MESRSLVLLVEDDAEHAELALRALERSDQVRVQVVDRLSEARRFLQAHEVDLVLSDLKLPDGSGLDLLDTGVPLVVQTSQGNEARAVMAMKGGALDYCVKSPEMYRDLARIIDRALRAGKNLRERQRAEQSLRESDERFRQLAENIPEAFWLYDLGTGDIVYASPAWSAVYGDCERTWAGRIARAHPDDRAALEAERPPSAPTSREFRTLRGRDVRWVEERMFPIRDASGGLFRIACLGADITKRHELESRLRQAQKMEAVGQLAGGVAHDFNNMLAAIMSAADELSAQALAPSAQQLCKLILQASERAAGLTRSLLSFSRMGRAQNRRVDVHELIREVVALLERSIDRRVTIRVDLDAPECWVNGDASQLQGAILNLGINARDAMPDGGALHITTQLASLDVQACGELPFKLAPGRFLVVGVEDSGSGIAEDVMPRIFEPFFTTKESGHGTGVGLAAVYGTMVEHRGAVTVQSQLGVGTRFDLYLPLLVSDQPLREAEPCAPAGKGLVLLVDDEPLVLSGVSQMLRSIGYDVVTARDGEEALRQFRALQRELVAVVCDAVMPRESGPEVLRRIGAEAPLLPCVLCSGFAPDSKLALGSSPWVLLPKPFRRADLAQTLAQAIAARSAVTQGGA